MIVEIAWPGGRQFLEDVAAADERVDLSNAGGGSMAGPLAGAPIAQAVVVSFHSPRNDEVVDQGEIVAVAAEDGEFCEVRLATASGTRTVDRAIECRVDGTATPNDDGPPDGGDAGSPSGDGKAGTGETGIEDERRNPLLDPINCELADGTGWSLYGRLVAVESQSVSTVGAG